MPAPKSVPLWKAVNRIAFGDFDASMPPDSNDQALKQATWKLREALRDGMILAEGDPGQGDDAKRAQIPNGFWNRHTRVSWSENSAILEFNQDWDYSEFESFSRITVRCRDVLKLCARKATKNSGLGRPPTFDEVDFLRLCVLEVNRGGLPKSRADLGRRMADLLQVTWPSVPEATWLKSKISQLYECEPKFQKAVGQLEGKDTASRK